MIGVVSWMLVERYHGRVTAAVLGASPQPPTALAAAGEVVVVRSTLPLAAEPADAGATTADPHV